jgi:hypothetical protein
VWPTIQAVSTPPPLPPVTNRLRSSDRAARDHGVDAADQVVVVLARVVVVDLVRELGAVARAAARVRVEHEVALRRVELRLGREVRAVGGERTAVDLEQQRGISGFASKLGG